MNILFVTHSLKIGGATKQLIMTANALSNYGHNIIVYTYAFNQNFNPLLNNQIQYIYENKELKGYKIKNFSIPIKIRKIVKQTHADIVVGWRTNAGCLVALGCIGLKVKTIFCERSDPYMEDNPILHIAKWICNYNKFGIFQTEGARLYYKRLKRHSIVIPNPYDADRNCFEIKKYSERKLEIAFVGRFELVQKRQDVMLRAFEIFHNKYPNYKLSFYGDGKDRIKIEEMTNLMGLTDYVFFHGAVTDVASKIADCKLLVLSSDYEGIPNVILEAFSVGVPVVSTDCSPGGVKLLINSGENGIIVPIRDYKSLANAMMFVISNEALADMFITNSKKRIKDFAPDIIFEKWNNYILNL